MTAALPTATDCVRVIKASGCSIYDPAAPGSPLYIPSPELEILLDAGLRGFSVVGLPLRT